MAADLNGDHKMDLAVTNLGSNTLSIFVGRGDGTFAETMAVLPGNGDGNPGPATLFSGGRR